jgi:polar amino acid transport system substrate-binding protein
VLLRNRFTGRLALAALFAASASAVGLGAASKPAMFEARQAAGGAKEFATHCSACHGDHLEGGAGPALSGATLGTLAKNTKLTVGDMFTFLAQEMPLNEPASLKHDQYVNIMAFILKSNGYPAGSSPLTYSGAMNSMVRITPASMK